MQRISSIKSYILILKKKVLSMNPLTPQQNKVAKRKKMVILLPLQEPFCSRKIFLNYIRDKKYLLLLIL